MKPVLLRPLGALPPTALLADAMHAAWPGAAVDATRSWYGPRVQVALVREGVALTLDLHHAQGRRRPVAVTTVRASCATRGLALRVLPARITRAMEPALAAHGGDLRAHHEVRALAAWDARRRRIARGLLAAAAALMVIVSLVTVVAMTPAG